MIQFGKGLGFCGLMRNCEPGRGTTICEGHQEMVEEPEKPTKNAPLIYAIGRMGK
jgi:hypothetical protein